VFGVMAEERNKPMSKERSGFAEMLATRWNNHDALVSALKDLLNQERVIVGARESGENSIFNDKIREAKQLLNNINQK